MVSIYISFTVPFSNRRQLKIPPKVKFDTLDCQQYMVDVLATEEG